MEYNVVFDELQNYTLKESNLKNLLTEIEKKVEKSEYFVPKMFDTLFWCLQCFLNREEDFDLKRQNIVTEKQLKILYVEKLRLSKEKVKAYKFASMTEIENELANEKKINHAAFLTLCVLENVNICVVKKNTYFELILNDTDVLLTLKEKMNGVYGFKEESIKENLENYRKNLYHVENLAKPLKAQSGYLLQDLINMSEKLGLSTYNEEKGKQKTKAELYEKLIQYF
jgi:hypothetical protein